MCTVDKSKVKISQNFVAFPDYVNFMIVVDMNVGFYSILLKVVIVDDETTRGDKS